MSTEPVMRVNYHAHTYRCHHAAGTEREYVEAAIAAGYRVFGFADHTPQPFPEGYVSRIRMTMEELEGYVRTVTDLQREYRGQIEIPLGLEVEYYPALFPELLRRAREYPIEYFLLGQHHLNSEVGGAYSGFPTEDPERLRLYCAQSLEALETGYFACFAHPDLIHFTGDREIYRREMEAMLRRVKTLGLPVELNMLGLGEGRNYPDPLFWSLVQEMDLPVIWGLDAHRPAHIGDQRVLALAAEFTDRYGLRLVQEIDRTRLR